LGLAPKKFQPMPPVSHVTIYFYKYRSLEKFNKIMKNRIEILRLTQYYMGENISTVKIIQTAKKKARTQ